MTGLPIPDGNSDLKAEKSGFKFHLRLAEVLSQAVSKSNVDVDVSDLQRTTFNASFIYVLLLY